MKRLIPAFIVLIITVAMCYAGSKTAYKYCTAMQARLENCKDIFLSENYEKTEQEIDSVIKEWNNKQKILALFVNHESLDGVTRAVNQLYTGIQSDNAALFLTGCADTDFFLEQIIKEQRLEGESFY